jgi:DNA polymerase III alpha subunit
MKQNKFGELIFSEADICNLIMQGRDPMTLNGMLVDDTVQVEKPHELFDDFPQFMQPDHDSDTTVAEWHNRQQSNWHMPEEYKNMDIAAHVLSLCNNEAELQRCGTELLLYQERNLFDLLRYLTYLVAVMQDNRIIWGVGRGSSVASYVLYKLGVHRIDSMYYDLDPQEFLR